MVKRDAHDTDPRDSDPRNTGSRNPGPRDTTKSTVSKPLRSTVINDFTDPRLNGRWVFSNEGYNNRVADLQFGQPDHPFIGYPIGGGDNQRVSRFYLLFLYCVQFDIFTVFLHPKCRLL